jgi:uncharacterized protein involved in exopolysaccharide biosynthesis
MDINVPAEATPPAARPRAPRSSPGSAAPPARGVSGGDLIALLRRNGWWILGCGLLAAVAAYGIAAMLPKSYTAESAIAVAGDRVAIPQLQGALQSDTTIDPMPLVNTEMQALDARQLIAGLVSELHLDRDPEFNAALRPPTIVGEIVGSIKSLFPKAPAPPGANAANDAVVNAVDHAFVFKNDKRSLVISVEFTAQDPVLAATVVNRLIADYIAFRSKRIVSADIGGTAAMTKQIAEVQADIERLERQMQQLRSSSGVVALRAGSVGQQQVEDLTIELSKAAVERSELQANLARASAAAASGSSDQLSTVLGSATISRLRDQESQAAGDLADVSAEFGKNYPQTQSAQAHLEAVRRQLSIETHRIVASLALQLKAAQAHEADIQRQLNDAHQAGAAAQDVQAQLDQLQQDITTRRTLYGTLLTAAQQTAAKPSGDSLPDVRVLNVAAPPGLPSSPKMGLVSGLGGLSGALFAGLVAFNLSSKHTRFRNEAEVARDTGANILACLRPGGMRWDGLAKLPVIAGTGAIALQTALTRMRTGGAYPARIIGIVAAQPGRRAACVAASLGRIAAQQGQSVLLVEYGGEKGEFSQMPAEPSPAAGRAADADWRDTVVPDAASPLKLLFGQLDRADPAYRAVALENLLVEAREEYDLIILGVPDAHAPHALSLARSCDTTVLVVDMATASPAATRDASGRLASLSHNPLGAIVLSTT